jgi:hypothetical protein
MEASPSGSSPNKKEPITPSSSSQPSLAIPPERFKDLCLRHTGLVGQHAKEIDQLLGQFFEPSRPLSVAKQNDVETLQGYLTGGLSFEVYKNKLKTFDTSTICGLVWNINYVAYRCRTCALSPCMSICAECFKNGDHEGHDYNMFRSGAGGAWYIFNSTFRLEKLSKVVVNVFVFK